MEAVLSKFNSKIVGAVATALLILTILVTYTMSQKKTLSFKVPLVPKDLDCAIINTYLEYVVCEQLVRRLISFNTEGHIVGDLVESWNHNPETETYNFRLKPNQKFSNGDCVTSGDVKASILRSKSLGKFVHYDLSNIKFVNTVDTSTIEIVLHKDDPLFLASLQHPEFGVLHPSDISSDRPKFAITTGAYSISSMDEHKISLIRNEHFPTVRPSLSNIIILDSNETTPDLIWPRRGEIIRNHDYVKSKISISFTHFISIDPRGELGDLAKRRYITYAIRSSLNHMKHPFSTADTLTNSVAMLPKLEMFDSDVKVPKLSLLVDQRQDWFKPLESELSNFVEQLDITYFNSYSEFAALTKASRYDLHLVNSDFSSNDPTESLGLLTSRVRPLAPGVENYGDVHVFLRKLRSEYSIEERIRTSGELENYLLEESLIIPLIKEQFFIHSKPTIVLDKLNAHYADLSLWKIQY